MKKNLKEQEKDINPQTRKSMNFQEIQMIRENLSDMNYGEFVLVFRNPDNPRSVKNRKITLKQALGQYEKSVINAKSMNMNEQRAERIAFCKAFLGLPEYLDKKDHKAIQDESYQMMESLQLENEVNISASLLAEHHS